MMSPYTDAYVYKLYREKYVVINYQKLLMGETHFKFDSFYYVIPLLRKLLHRQCVLSPAKISSHFAGEQRLYIGLCSGSNSYTKK